MSSDRVANELSQLVDGSLSLEDFFASAMHEAAQPLSAIMALCATLRSLDASLTAEERAQFIGDIENQVRYLQKLGNAVLRPCPPEPKQVDQLIERITNQCRPSAIDHAFEVTHDVGSAMITCDQLRFESAIRNLVKNATEHSPDGSTITLSATVADGELKVSVSDEGDGIPHADWERVFNPYVRLRADNPRHKDGKGIGLALVRLFAEQSGGSARIEKSGETGTTFMIALPVDPA